MSWELSRIYSTQSCSSFTFIVRCGVTSSGNEIFCFRPTGLSDRNLEKCAAFIQGRQCKVTQTSYMSYLQIKHGTKVTGTNGYLSLDRDRRMKEIVMILTFCKVIYTIFYFLIACLKVLMSINSLVFICLCKI